jgi:hypothetical protein
MPREIITAYATLKKAAANANHHGRRLDDRTLALIVQVCDEILGGQHHDMFPLHVWMTGSGTQFNMNVNEVISNRSCQLAGTPLGSKTPVHPNDHVNMSQSSNDTFPSAMYVTAAVNVTRRLIPAVEALHDAIAAKAADWNDIVKIGRTHMQDATPLTLGQEWSGYAGMLADDVERIEDALNGVYRLALGGTVVGTGINAAPGFAEAAAAEIARLTKLPFVSAPNKFTVQGAHDALVQLSGTFRTTGRVALQDRQRHPPDVLRATGRLRRAADSGERAWLVDHAGQGQSDAGRSTDDDRCAGHGERCGRRLRRRQRLPRDERLHGGVHPRTDRRRLGGGASNQKRSIHGRRLRLAQYFAALCGVGLCLGYALLGASWLLKKCDAEVRDLAWRQMPYLVAGVLVFLAVVFIYALAENLQIMGRWIERPYLFVFPAISAAAGAVLVASVRRRRDQWPFTMVTLIFLSAFGTLAISFWPYMIPFALTVDEAAAPHSVLPSCSGERASSSSR